MCKTFQETLAKHRLAWLRIVQGLGQKYNLAPHSFDSTDKSVPELKGIVTRLNRLSYSIEVAESDPLPQKVVLAALEFDRNIKTPQAHPPVLLPGGRWLLGLVESPNHHTHLFCWDLSHVNGVVDPVSVRYQHFLESLAPVAQTSFAGIPASKQGLTIQLDAGGETVNIGVLSTLDKRSL